MQSPVTRGYAYAEASLEIQWATSLLLYGDQAAEIACNEIKRNLGYDFVAIQLSELLQQIVQTVYGSGLTGKWYKLASHSLKVPDEFRDIQAHIAVARPPIIEVVEGEHPRFDRFIYTKMGHENYARAFVPLILNRNEKGQLTRARCEDFDFHFSGRDGRRRVAQLIPRSASRRYEIIGTIEAGFDNRPRPCGRNR